MMYYIIYTIHYYVILISIRATHAMYQLVIQAIFVLEILRWIAR